MLVLSRKCGESIVVPECELTISVVKISGNRVRLTIQAPEKVRVHRKEAWLRRLASPGAAEIAEPGTRSVPR
jgi:carbon storage regulator